MKRVICVLCLLVWLFIGSVSVFADPHVVPDSSNVCLAKSSTAITGISILDSGFFKKDLVRADLYI